MPLFVWVTTDGVIHRLGWAGYPVSRKGKPRRVRHHSKGLF